MLKLLLQLRQKHVTTCDVFYSSITGVQSRSSGWKSKILTMCLHTVASGAEGRRFTRMTMAMGPAKLQMSLSSMEIQQKSGFPYPSGSRPTARPAAKGEGRKRRRGLVTDELFLHGELGRKNLLLKPIGFYRGTPTRPRAHPHFPASPAVVRCG